MTTVSNPRARKSGTIILLHTAFAVVAVMMLIQLVQACAIRGDDPAVAVREALADPRSVADIVEPYRFPMVGSIDSCNATLITPSHAITAAHCVESRIPEYVDFAPSGAGMRPTRFSVVGCSMPNLFSELLLRRDSPALRRPEFADLTLTALGDRCAVFLPEAPSFLSAGETKNDYAVLTLERPVPHAVATPETIGAVGSEPRAMRPGQ